MRKPAPRILFLSHSASRNGAAILLQSFVQWLKCQVDWELEIVVEGRGPLVDGFRSVAPTRVLRSTQSIFCFLGTRGSVRWQNSADAFALRAFLMGRRYDLIYANTSATWKFLPVLARQAASVLWHIHELEYALRLTAGEAEIENALSVPNRIIAVSRAVCDVLVRDRGVPEENVDVVHGFVPWPIGALREREILRDQIMKQLGWPREAFVVGACGSPGWRKGTDLFLQIAHAVKQSTGYENMFFLWVGGEPQGKTDLEFKHDVRALGLEGCCVRVPDTAAVADYYSLMDVFALTSREDPFPLVMLEAGSFEIPVVCFAGSGGGPEFVAEDAGLTAPYSNVISFADCLKKLRDSQELRVRLGVFAATKVRRQYGVDTQGPKLVKSIEKCLSSSMAPQKRR